VPLPRLPCQQYIHATVCRCPSFFFFFFFRILVLSSEVVSFLRFERNDIRIVSFFLVIVVTGHSLHGAGAFFLVVLPTLFLGLFWGDAFAFLLLVAFRFLSLSSSEGIYTKHFADISDTLGCSRPIDIKSQRAVPPHYH
jgi:hypothetical protein